MRNIEHKSCYGTVFPDACELQSDRTARGKVFSAEVQTPVGVVRRRRRMTVNLSEWDDCLACPEFDTCIKFCMGKLICDAAVREG